MKHPLGFVALASLVLVLSGTSSATVQTAQSEGAQQFADFGDFPIEGDGEALLFAYPDNLERLPEAARADVRWTGSTALHGAAIMDQLSIIQFLVEKGARLDARNKLGWTPLMVTQGMLIAANGRWKPRAEALIRHLMIERGLDPVLHSQRRLSTSTDARPRQ